MFAVKLDPGGVAVWEITGRLVKHFPHVSDLSWESGGDRYLSYQGVVGKNRSISTVLTPCRTDTFLPLTPGLSLSGPRGQLGYLIRDNTRTQCLATWNDEDEWGYVGVDTVNLTQSPITLTDQGRTLSPPGFSPDGQYVVSCLEGYAGWWADPDEPDAPSAGGTFEIGEILVQDVRSLAVTRHAVCVDVLPGWRPDQPESFEWQRIWGPEFESDRSFRIWLPDDSVEVLSLPLPPTVYLRRPLRQTRFPF